MSNDNYISKRNQDSRRQEDYRDDRRHEDKVRDKCKDRFDFDEGNCKIVIFAEKVKLVKSFPK